MDKFQVNCRCCGTPTNGGMTNDKHYAADVCQSCIDYIDDESALTAQEQELHGDTSYHYWDDDDDSDDSNFGYSTWEDGI